MAYKCCVVPQCTSTRIKNRQKLFVSFPTNPKRRKIWLQLARRNRFLGLFELIEFYVIKITMEKDTTNYMKYKMGYSQKILLADEDVPSKFHCQEDRKRRLYYPVRSRELFLKRQRSNLITECLYSQNAETYAESLQKDDNIIQPIIEPEEIPKN